MIVHLKNLIHPTRILSGSSSVTAIAIAAAATKRSTNRNQLALPLLLQSTETGSHGHHHRSRKKISFLSLSGRSPSSLSLGFHSEKRSNDLFPHKNTNNTSNINSRNPIFYGDPMQACSGGSNRTYRSNSFHGIGVVPLIAAKFSSSLATTATATCCWSSVLILLLLSSTARNNIHGGSNPSRRYPSFRASSSWGSSILPSAATATATATAITRSMSSYSVVFADAFHPSPSYSAKEHEKDNDGGKSSTSDNDHQESSASKSKGNESDALSDIPETNSVDDENEATCDANKMGRPHPENDRLALFHFDSTTSTQDEAKSIAKGLKDASGQAPDAFCVTATSQSNGRGTTGRQWLGAPGNVFVTIGIPVDVWMTRMLRERRIPLTLLPLKIGDLTASLVKNQLDDCGAGGATVTVKWPNDVLVDGKKISGTLIENASDWFLIGIGINIAHAPTVPTTGTDYGRPSVSLLDYCSSGSSISSISSSDDAEDDSDSKQQSKEAQDHRDQKARELGVQLALDFHRWIYENSHNPSSTADSIVEGWKRWLDWDAQLTMRNDQDKEGPRRVVKLLNVLPDGRIRVANTEDGKEEILVSDYFV
jgi:BirA family biotin operon repressor/biotin-[acetyl-CoA-carboxylase] ligase